MTLFAAPITTRILRRCSDAGRLIAFVLAVALFAVPAAAQTTFGPSVVPTTAPQAPWPAGEPGTLNPLAVMESAGRALPGAWGAASGVPEAAPTGGKRGGGLSAVMSVMLLLTVVTLAPAILLMCTCFVRIIVVLGLLKQAIGAQSVPPPQVITALALFMTMLVMSPTVDRVYHEAVVPYQSGEVESVDELWDRAKQPVRDFMFAQLETTGNWSSLYMVMNYRGVDTTRPESIRREDVGMTELVPAFMLSELKTAFLMGFRVYLPFLVIDMVISGLLISMSMMMLPPVMISLPFKLLLFVLVDGWALIVGNLMRSFAHSGTLDTAMGVFSGGVFG